MLVMSLAARLKPAHLSLIVRIAETGKLHLAAERSAMSQPAASRILAEVERRAGVALFDRAPDGMRPTAAGQAVIKHARSILEGLDNLDREIDLLRSGRAGTVRIGAVTGPAVGSVVPAIRACRKRAPDLEISVEVLPSAPLVAALAERQFDFILGRIPADADARPFHLAPARTERVTLLVDRDHPCAGRTRVGLRDLLDHEWVVQERVSPIRSAVEQAFRERGLPTPSKVTNSSSLLVALAMIEGSSAIAPQSDEVARLIERQGGATGPVRLDLEDEITVSPFFVIRNRAHELSRAAEMVLDEVLSRL